VTLFLVDTLIGGGIKGGDGGGSGRVGELLMIGEEGGMEGVTGWMEMSEVSKMEGWLEGEGEEKYCQFEADEVEEGGYGNISSWKTTFLKIKISLESRSERTNPLNPDL